MNPDLVVINIGELVTLSGDNEPRRGAQMSELSIVPNGALAVQDGKITGAGPEEEVLGNVLINWRTRIVDAGGRSVIPGLVDCHTHAVYAGDRHDEFVLKRKGADYLDILEAGGGINATVQATREASVEDLIATTAYRLNEMVAVGTTTVEVKSGYGLSLSGEGKLLDVIEAVGESSGIRVVPTFLGAHAVPEEFKGETRSYVEKVIRMVDKLRGRARFCDVFCENRVFDAEASRYVLTAAREAGFGLKLHADEVETSGGAELAAELGAVSADHLLYPSDEGVEMLARTDTVAVLLPSTSYYLGERFADARRFIEAGLPVAVASDHNPGTSPVPNMLIPLGLALFGMGLSPQEVLTGATINGAYALGLGEVTGSLEPGKDADFVVLNADSYVHLFYEWGRPLAWRVFSRGEEVFRA